MIVSKTPLRISIAGGGTDLRSYYARFGGFFISASINRYIFISVNPTFTGDYFIRYSANERVERIDDIQHRMVREVLRRYKVGPVEMVSLADVPAGTGLGSSGTFAVGLLRAVYALQRRHATSQRLAEEAYYFEEQLLQEPVGLQDQYIAAYGGITCFDIDQAGKVTTFPLDLSEDTIRSLEEQLLLFYTGKSRTASDLLMDQKVRSESDQSEMIDNLHFIKQLADEVKAALMGGDVHRFGELMHRHWLEKRKRSKGMSNAQIDGWYDLGLQNGAVGGKLVGAGGGGFLMFLADNPAKLRAAMSGAGLSEVRFNFDFDGSQILFRE